MLAPKKRDHALARRQLYLNYGALSLASILDADGYDAALFHGEHHDPLAMLDRLSAMGRLPSQHPVMLSLPSFYALPWAKEFCRALRQMHPEARIIAGGRWVVGPDVEWLKAKLPQVDHFVPGLGEPVLESLLTDTPNSSRLSAPVPDIFLNHRLVDDFERYQPSIEASRGCGMGCVFCEERDIKVDPLQAPAAIVAAMRELCTQYASPKIRPYLQASMFLPSRKWAEDFAHEVERGGTPLRWRTESRVDAILPETVRHLAHAGLAVLDLGLETASPTQIIRMNKSRDPERYLTRASELLQACEESGVAAKVNVLLYAGETSQTLSETRSWLDEHASAIAGVSVGPVVAYGPPRTADILIDDWANLGARPVDPASAEESGITHMHLSKEFDAKEAEIASLTLSRRYMDADAYWKLKSFSYYPRGYTRANFEADVTASDSARLPFST